jgi:glycerol-3-phosphate dehydrogenase
MVTIVGGKLTTYRRMAQDALDAVLAAAGRSGGPCRTRRLPLVGAAGPDVLDAVAAPRRLVRLYGTEAPDVVAAAGGDPTLLEPLDEQFGTTGAEVLFAARREGALDAGDVLDRRTRIGLDPLLRERLLPVVETLLRQA